MTKLTHTAAMQTERGKNINGIIVDHGWKELSFKSVTMLCFKRRLWFVKTKTTETVKLGDKLWISISRSQNINAFVLPYVKKLLPEIILPLSTSPNFLEMGHRLRTKRMSKCSGQTNFSQKKRKKRNVVSSGSGCIFT